MGVAVGFAAHLAKPVNMQRLEEAIAQVAGDRAGDAVAADRKV